MKYRLDKYGNKISVLGYGCMRFTQRAGKIGLRYASSKGLLVMIMEPLRGGRLVNNLPEKAQKLLENYETKRTPAEWAFRWLWNQPEVTCVLSGMNSISMVEENVRNASTSEIGEFTQKELNLLEEVVKSINKKMKVGCTGCGYCMPCPKKVDIPGTFSAYNKLHTDGKFIGLKEYVMCTVLRKDSTSASNCIECGKCEQHCPQHIEIRKELKNAKKELEGPAYKIAKKVAKLFLKY